jgi:hypothetical protein
LPYFPEFGPLLTVPDQRLAKTLRLVLPPVLAGVVLFGLSFVGAERVLASRTQPGSRDVDLFAAIVAKVVAGLPYYSVLAEELPARGYPIRPMFVWRLPTLSWLLAGIPPAVAQGLLWIIGALAIWSWAKVLRLRWAPQCSC